MNVIEATGLGRRFGWTWALRNCSLAVPAGRVTALVGPNGAGKSTLLHLAVGLARPTEGDVRVLGGMAAGSPEALERVAFVAQNAPLYHFLPVRDMMHLARNLNQHWDQARADRRLAALDIPLNRKVGKLSGGQQAQVALTIALARRPEFLVLDEPLAPLDPLARHQFLASVMEAVAEDGISVLFSSHALTELERVADYLVVLAGGRVQVAGDAGDLLATHRMLTGPAYEVGQLGPAFDVVHGQCAQAQAHVLARFRPPTPAPDGWRARPVTLEELVLAYLREPGASALPGPESLGAGTFTPGDAVTAFASGLGADTVESGRPSRRARLVWVTWRQHRATLIGLILFVVVMAAYTAVYGLRMHGTHSFRCVGPGTEPVQCQVLLQATYAVLFSGFLIPVALGMFVGAPLLAREYSAGTARFAWTQGAGRIRPTLAKLILLGLAVLAAAVILGWLNRWAVEPPAGQSPAVTSGWNPLLFASAPVTGAASALLCYAAGVLAGALTWRVVPAMVATAAAFAALSLFAYGRLYYWMLGFGTLRTTYPGFGVSQLTGRAANLHAPGGRFNLHQAVSSTAYSNGPAVRWLDQGWYADAHGHPLRGAALLRVIHHPWRLAQFHDTFWATYQPVSRFWLFQSAQASAELLLALILGALAIWLVQRRIA